VTNITPVFLAKFPLGKVPAFESGDGKFFLTEAQAIARYVAESGPMADQLLGADARTRALIEQWSCFSDQELAANIVPPLLMTVWKLYPFDEAAYAKHAVNFERAINRVEAALQGGRKFLVGEQLTLADIMVFGPLHLAGKFFMDAEMRKGAPSVEGYLKGLMEVPELKKAFGELELCEKRVQQ
jgi:elongation factor 1-gamma